MSTPTTLLDARAIDRTLRRIADEIVELNNGTDNLVVVGIERRGVQLADRIIALIERQEHATVARGALDITLYRDDLQTVGPRPVVGRTTLPLTLDGKRVVIVDDVLYTGRTIRAALAVLVDRGGRELPIHADIVGRTIDAPAGMRVDVLLSEVDERDAVILADRGAA